MSSHDLTPSQTHALSQLQDLTNTGREDDSEELIGVLTAVDWDVAKAAEIIFDGSGGGGHAGPSTRSSRYQEFDIDDSEQSGISRGRDRASPRQPPASSLITQIIAYPLHIISSLFRFIFTLLRLRNPIPYIPFLSLNPFSRGGGWSWSHFGRGGWSQGRIGRGGVERWIRELEEETGGVCVNSTSGDSMGVGDSTGVAGPSRLISRHAASSSSSAANGRPLLPPFISGSYDSILRMCSSSQKPKVGVIILVSSEYTPDDAVFKNQTLTNSELVNILSEEVLGLDEDERGNDDEEALFICWGGDVVRDKDAYEASLKLGATTFPFVAFVALQGGRGFISASAPGSTTTAATATATLTVLSRHLGSSACTPEALTTHLTSVLLPRVKPYLRRVRLAALAKERDEARVRESRERERELRQAQDRAFEASKLKDYERLKKRMEEEKEKAERESKEERERIWVEERAREREGWRGWFKSLNENMDASSSSGTTFDSYKGTRSPDNTETIRIAVRLPDGKRLMRKFRKDDTLDLVYAWVDGELGPSAPSMSGSSTQLYSFSALQALLLSLPTSATSTSPSPQQKWWGFSLLTSYPRKAIPWAPNVSMESSLMTASGGGGAQLVVEMISSGYERNEKGKGKAKEQGLKEDDGYVTESSDEE